MEVLHGGGSAICLSILADQFVQYRPATSRPPKPNESAERAADGREHNNKAPIYDFACQTGLAEPHHCGEPNNCNSAIKARNLAPLMPDVTISIRQTP